MNGQDSQIPATYVSAKGTTYYLCRVPGATGQERLVASRSIVGTPLPELPEGYEFSENVNGLVSVRKTRLAIIREDEVALVEAVLGRMKGGELYRVRAAGNAVVIFEPDMWPDRSAAIIERAGISSFPGATERTRAFALAHARYAPLVRLVLEDRVRRTFTVERRTFSGREGWLPVAWGRTLRAAASDVARRLGPQGPQDAFFDWD